MRRTEDEEDEVEEEADVEGERSVVVVVSDEELGFSCGGVSEVSGRRMHAAAAHAPRANGAVRQISKVAGYDCFFVQTDAHALTVVPSPHSYCILFARGGR